MRLVYGMTVEVERQGEHRIEEDGQRILLFQVIQDLLLFMAHRDRHARARVILGRRDGHHLIRLEPERPASFETPEGWGYDLLEHVAERLYQIEGHLNVGRDRTRVRRIAIRVPVEEDVARAA